MKPASKTSPTTSSVYDPATEITYTSQYDIFTVGAGYVDLGAALASSELSSGTAMSPTAVYDSNTGNVRLTSDSSSIWGASQTWSGPAVWGSTQFTGSSIMWGATTSGGSSILWGAYGLWGCSSIAGGSPPLGVSKIWSNKIIWVDGRQAAR